MRQVKNYLKNVTKSIAFATADVTAEMMPNTGELAQDNKEFFTSTYALLKNPPAAMKKSIASIQQSKVYQALDYGARNAVEDLRTGNFYNKEREDRDTLKYAGLDTDWDDLSEFGISDDWESNIGKDSGKSEVTAGDKQIVQSIEATSVASTNTTVNAVIATSNAQIKNSRTNTAMLYTQNQQLFKGLHADISVLDNTMKSMHNLLSTSLQNIDSNMASFFTESLKLDKERNAILKEMLEMQRNQYKSASQKEEEAARKKKPGRARWKDISLAGGTLNFDSYFDAVKKNISNEISGMGIAGFSDDSNMLATFMTSPLKGAMKAVVDGLIPATVKVASKQFDDTLSGMFGTIMGRLANARDDKNGKGGGLLGMIGKFLGISTGVNKTVDTGKYEKGPVPFDGITRKAIIDVIPTYLRRIEAALTGRPEEGFDYKTGTWKTMNTAYKEYKSKHTQYVNQATDDAMKMMQPGLKAIKFTDKTANDEFQKAQDEFREFLYDMNFEFYPDKSANDNGVPMTARYLRKYYDILCMIWSQADLATIVDKKGRKKTRRISSAKMQGGRKVLEAKDRENQEYRMMEDGGFISQYFSVGGKKGVDRHGRWNDKNQFNFSTQLAEYKDSLGNTMYDYLRNINQELAWQRESWGNMGVFIEGGEVAYAGYGSGGSSSSSTRKRKTAKAPTKTRQQVSFDKINVTNKSKQSQTDSDFKRRAAEREAHEKKMIADINAGKGIDYRDMEVDPEAFKNVFVSMMQGETGDSYAELVSQQANKNMITRAMAKHGYKDTVATTKEMEAAVKRANKEAESGDVKLDEDESNFLTRILNKMAGGASVITATTGAGAEAITNMMYVADQAVYDMFFKSEIKGGDGEKYDGFLDMISKKTQETFKKAQNTLEENIFTPFKERLFEWMGMDGNEFKKRFGDTAKSAGKKVWSTFKESNKSVYGPAFHQAKVELGLAEGESMAQRNRKAKRSDISRNIDFANGASNLTDEQFISLLSDYGLAFTSYDNIDDAKAALMPLLYQDMFKATNGMTEFSTDASYAKSNKSSAAASKRVKEYAMKYATTDKKAMQKSARKQGFVLNGSTDEEIAADFTNKMNNGASTDTRNDRNRAIAMVKVDGGATLAEWCESQGFTGKIDEKKRKLIMMGAPATEVGKLKDEVQVNLKFARLQRARNAKGTVSGVPFSGNTMLSKNELVFSGTGNVTRVPKTGYYNISSPSHILNSESSYDLMKSAGVSSKTLGVKSTVQQDIGRENLAAKSIAKHATGTESAAVKVNNKGDIDEYLHEAKQYIPEAAAGGVIGGVTSLLLGLVGGPLVGAAVGAGTSLIAKSDKFKDIIFGKTDEKSGERQGGIVSKTVMDTVKKYAPDALKYGMAGIIPGLLTPLGPLGGMAVGAGIGLLKNNEKFTNKYFGENGKLTFSSKEKKIIEKLIPGAAGGAAVGTIAGFLFGGPFGIVGNAAIGSAIGMMTTTDEFKELFIGKEINGVRMGGLLGSLKDAFSPLTDIFKNFAKEMTDILDNKIVDPLKRFLVPAIHRLPRLFGAIPGLLGKAMNKAFGRDLTGRITDAIKGPIIKLVKAPLGLVKGAANVVSLPFQGLGKIGDRWTRKDIMKGYDTGMTASERIEWMNDKGYGDDITGFDEALAGIGTDNGMSVEDAKKMRDNFSMITQTSDAAKKTADQKWKQIQKYVDNYKTPDGKRLDFTPKSKKRIYDLLKQGKEDEAIKELRKLTVRGEGRTLTKEELGGLYEGENGLGEQMHSFTKNYDSYTKLKGANKEAKDAAKSDLAKYFESLGMEFDPSDPKMMQRYMTLLDTEITNREAGGHGLNPDELDEENNALFKKMAASLDELVKANLAIATNNTDELKKMAKEHDIKNIQAEASNDAHFDKKEEQAREMLGKDEEGNDIYDELDDETKDALTASNAGFEQNVANKLGKIPVVGKVFKNPANPVYGKATKLLKRASQSNFGSAILNEIQGQGNGKEIQKLIMVGFKFDDGAAKMVNSFDQRDMKLFNSFINGDVTAVFYGHKITTEDVEFCLKNGRYKNKFLTRCKIIRKAVKDYTPYNSSFANIFAIDTATMNNLSKRSRGITDVLSGDVVDTPPEENPGTELAPIESSTEVVATNGLGTMLLSGLGSLVSGIGKGVSSLFKKKDSGDESSGVASGALSALDRLKSKESMLLTGGSGGAGNFDEVDTPGDGKDIAQVGTDFIQVKKGTDGSVEPDTTDSNTKTVMNKLQQEQDANAKLRDAQLAAAEATTRANDTSEFKESKGGKLGWLSLLLVGGVLWKSGILTKIYENMIKPLWTEKIYPWITDKAIPWLKDTALPAIGNAISTIVTDVLPGVLSTAASGLVDLLCDALPSVISAAIKGVGGVVGGVLDAVSGGNTTNAGSKTTVNASDKVESGEGDTVTGMYDENGNSLTYEDIANGNYTKIYNADGTEGTVNEDGSVTFKDTSVRGSSYAKKAVNAMGHAIAHGNQGTLNKLVSKGSSALSTAGKFLRGKSGSKVSKVVSKIPGSKLLGRVSSATSSIGNVVSAPARLGEYLSTGIKNTANNVIDAATSGGSATGAIVQGAKNMVSTAKNKASTWFSGTKVGKAASKITDAADTVVTGAYTYADDAAKAVKNSSIGQKAGSFLSNVGSKIKTAVKGSSDDVVEDVAKAAANSVDDVAANAVETAVSTAAKGSSSSKATLISKCADAIESLFGNSKILKKITSAAESIGITKVTEWIGTFKKNVTSIFDDAIAKGVEKVGSETLKKAVSKANLILTVATIIADFLTGCDQAESILGVTETNIVEEVVAGLINALCNLLIIPSIIPGVNWIARKLYNLFGDSLDERQEEADEEYEAWKEETGSTASKEEYLKQQYSVTGKIGGFFKNAGSKVVNTVKNAGSTVVSGVKKVGSGIANGVKSIGSGIKNFFTGGSSDEETETNAFGTFSLSNIFNKTGLQFATADGISLNGDSSSSGLLGTIGTGLSKILSNAIGDGSGIASAIEEADSDDVVDQAQNGELSIFSSEYWTVSDEGTGITGIMKKSYKWLTRLINAPQLLVQSSIGTMIKGISNIGSWITDKFSGIAEFFSNPLDFIYKKITGQGEKDKDGNTNDLTSISMNEDGDLTYMDGDGNIISQYNTKSDTTTTAADIAETQSTDTSTSTTSTGKSGFISKVKNTFGSLFGSAKKLFGLGEGPDYVKQIDPSVANLPYNAGYDTEYQTIGDSACGPAAAVNAVRAAYGRGSNDLINASNYALAGGYKEQNGGTYPEFFTDYFSQNGLGSSITSNRSAIADSIRAGNPTVLMGQDANGTNSSNPFGKTSHYVTVTGTDSYGRAVVQDPESKYDNQIYDVNDLMRKTTLGISAYGKKRRSARGKSPIAKWARGKFGRGLFGRGNSSIIFVGDSRTVGMQTAVGDDGNTWICKVGAGTKWFKEQLSTIKSNAGSGKAIVILMGVNDVATSTSYKTYANTISDNISKWTDAGSTVYYVSVNPIDESLYTTFTNDTIKTWNSNLQGALPENVTYIDTFSTMLGNIVSSDGLHYDSDTYKTIYELITDVVLNGATVNSSSISSSSSSTSSTTTTSASDTANSIVGSLSYILSNSKAGQALSLFTGSSSSSSSSTTTSDDSTTSDTSSDTSTTGTGKFGRGKFGRGRFGRSKYGRGNAEKIWYALKQAGFSEYGAAATMGNLEAESGMDPTNLQNTYESKLGYSDSEYTNAVDNGSYSNFVKDSAGYGLAQWTYYTRKQNLYDAVKAAGASVGDLATQVNFLLSELSSGYSSVYTALKNATDVKTASNKMLHDFESPADQSSSVETKRANMGQAWYDKLKGTEGEELSGVTAPGEATSSSSSSSSDSSSAADTIISALSNILADSKAGQALALFTGSSSSSSSTTTTTSTDSSDGSTTVLGDSDAANVANVALGEVGVKETGTNYVKYNDWYWGDGVGGSSYPWCAAFVSWVANQAGISTDIIPKDAYTVTAYQKITGNKGKAVDSSEARAGDVIYFTKNGSSSGIYHTGIVTGNDGSTISTVEGNSSDQVKQNSYNVGSSKLLVARPGYENQGSSSSTVNVSANTTATDSTTGSTQGGNGYKPVSKYGTFKDNLYGMGRVQLQSKGGSNKVEVSEIDEEYSKAMKSLGRKFNYRGTNKGATGQGTSGVTSSVGANGQNYNDLLTAIIKVLMTIADNTDKLNTVVNLLSDYTGVEASAQDVSEATSATSLKSKISDLLGGISGSNATSGLSNTADNVSNSSMQTIISALNAIASE